MESTNLFCILDGDELYALFNGKIIKVENDLDGKADLGVDGKIKISQLPEAFVADPVIVETYADLPTTGDSGALYQVENDPDASKNGYYKWVGDRYFQYNSDQNYYNITFIGDSYTMGNLATAVADINLQGQHVLFDLHSFIDGAYVCLIHFETGNKCIIFDMLNQKVYGIGETYTDSQLVSDYVEGSVKDLTDTYSVAEADAELAKKNDVINQVVLL